MPAAEVRDLHPDDLDAALRVRALSFGALTGAAEEWTAAQLRFIDTRRALGAYVDGRLAGMARISDFRQWWHGRDLRMGGIAGVVIGPEHRGRGVGRALMTGVIDRLRELDYPVSALYPATVPLYRSLGWELAGRQYQVTVPGDALRELARGAAPVPLQAAGPGDAQTIVELIDARHREHLDHGPLARPTTAWTRRLGGDEAIYLAEDGLVAYDWSGDGALHVSHLGARSVETTRALWALVGSGSSIARTVTAHLAPDDPLPWLLPDLGVEPAPEHWWMLRLLDPAAAFASRGYPAGASVEAAFTLVDPQLSDLSGSWVLSVADGSGSFLRDGRTSGSPYVLGPGGLAALFAGTRLSSLRRAGLVTGGTAGTDSALDTTFAGTPFLLDYF